MKQWIKPLALLTAVSMLAGCAGGGSASSQEAGGVPAEPYVPMYTYENPDPDMVLVSAPGGDITYQDYRLYLDVNEGLARYSARQTLALSAAVTYDLEKNFGIETSEEAFQQFAGQEVMMAYYYSPSVFANLETVSKVSGLDDAQVSNAMIEGYRSQYLVNQLGVHFQQELEKDFPPVAADSGTEDAQAEAAAEQERQQKLYEAASQKMSEYSVAYDTRLVLDNESDLILGTFDGIELPITDSGREFIEYSAISGRVEAASFIQEGELALRDLETMDSGIERSDFEETFASYRESILSQELLVKELTRICALYGATIDDYLKALERPLWLQYAADLYYNAINEQYNALDSGDRPETIDEYFATRINAALEGSELVNISGKASSPEDAQTTASSEEPSSQAEPTSSAK